MFNCFFICLEAILQSKTQYYVIIYNFLTQNVQYLHNYKAVPTKTYSIVNTYVLNSSSYNFYLNVFEATFQ
jgi:hypothetical protein